MVSFNKSIYLSLFFLGIFSIPLGLVPSQVMVYLTGLLQKDASVQISTIWPVIVLFLVSTLALAMLDATKSFLSGMILEHKVQNRISEQFARILKTSPDFFRKNEASKISKRLINETRQAEHFWLNLKTTLPILLLGLVGFGYVMFFGINTHTPLIGAYIPANYSQTGNWFLGCLILFFAPLQGSFLLFDRKIQGINRRAMIVDDDVANTALETIENCAEIRSHFAFDFALARMKKDLDRLRHLEIDITKVKAIFSGIGPTLDGLTKVLLLAMGARLCIGELNLGFVTVSAIEWKDYMGFAGIAMLVNGNVKGLTNTLFQWRMSKEMLSRVNEFENTPIIFTDDQSAPAQNNNDSSIKYADLSLSTPDGTRILNKLNFTLQPGEHVAFVGPSGCGKSTAMNLIIRELSQSSGNVLIGTHSLDKLNFASLAQELGHVRQKPILFDMSLRDNLLFSIHATQPDNIDTQGLNKELIAVIRKVGLEDDLRKKGLDSALPPACSQLGLAKELDKLRALFHQQHADAKLPMVRFEIEQPLANATVAENLLFGKIPEATPHDNADKKYALAKLVSSKCNGSTLLVQLQQCGLRAILHDRRISMFVQHTSAKLFAKIAPYLSRIEQLGADDPSDILTEAISDTATLSAKQKMILLDIALNMPLHMAQQFAGQELATELLHWRTQISPEEKKQLGCNSFGVAASETHPLREILIGGRVQADIHGALKQVDDAIFALLKEQNLTDDLILAGLETPAGPGGQALSGGQAMKVAIARILLKKPSILLLDEATAALDEKSQAQIVRLIKEDFKDRTVISISHRLSTIRDYDRILVFDRGQIVQQGTYTELVEQQGLFRELVQQEVGEELPPADKTSEGSSQRVEDVKHALSVSPLFRHLKGGHLDLFENMIRYIECPTETVLFNRGDDGNELYILIEGQIEFFVENVQGEISIVDTCEPGSVFGELALFGKVPRTLGARAAKTCRLGVLSREELLTLVNLQPEIAVALLESTAQRIAKERTVSYGA